MWSNTGSLYSSHIGRVSWIHSIFPEGISITFNKSRLDLKIIHSTECSRHIELLAKLLFSFLPGKQRWLSFTVHTYNFYGLKISYESKQSEIQVAQSVQLIKENRTWNTQGAGVWSMLQSSLGFCFIQSVSSCFLTKSHPSAPKTQCLKTF